MRKNKTISIRVDEILYNYYVTLANNQKRTLSDVIRMRLEEYQKGENYNDWKRISEKDDGISLERFKTFTNSKRRIQQQRLLGLCKRKAGFYDWISTAKEAGNAIVETTGKRNWK